MNVFRLSADLSHLVAIFILIFKIRSSKSCSGISARSQILFALVFSTRYADIFTVFVSPYNTAMKIIFLVATYYTVYLIFYEYRITYEKESDNLRFEFLFVPCVLLSLYFTNELSVLEVLWTFSIFLESVAIMPQLFMLQNLGSADTITAHYLFFLGSYRALYLINWIYRYYTESYFEPVATFCGILQTILYADFFYLYFTRVSKKNTSMELTV
ncbi:hypothetical protein WR25_08463 [Diploscapter pachys]|uniref:ER lumen protein-retaining receptor n=1 Tax=Diploscapter pachys TaxID=2018661 RepID=A0A2A2L543_9BILA|nr:hypothetical protein WR25_08463 [Diploscapter pachys]